MIDEIFVDLLKMAKCKMIKMHVQDFWSSRVSIDKGVHGVHDEKRIWFEVELQGAQRDHEVEVFQNGLVKETNVTLLAKVRCFLIQSGLSKVEPLGDHTLEVEPQENVDQGAGYKKEDSNKAAFAVAAMEKIYAHESLNFNHIVACEVISKWKAGLKDDMDVRSDVYVLSNGCRKCSDDSDGYYWEYTPGFFLHAL
nr:zinc finger, CCHC-type [Tanacetum cinerariifolium]